MPEFLMRRIGPFPVYVYVGIVIVAGVAFYVWYRQRSNVNAANQAQSTSGVAGANPAYNPLNPNNDPNIDPNTGVPYQLEEAINPNTGAPYYYSSAGTPGTPSSPGTPTPAPGDTNPAPTAPTTTPTAPLPAPAPAPAPAAAAVTSTIGGQPAANGAISYASNVNTQFSQPGEVVPSGGKTYTFEPVGNTGQTNHLWNVAIQEYGVQGTTATNAATQAIINANPNLSGKSFTYQPPVGTQITIPQL